MNTILCFEDWYDEMYDKLSDFFVTQNTELFPTSESMCDVEQNVEFVQYVDEKYEEYKSGR